MKRKLPNYFQLEQFYSINGTLDEIKAQIGGDVDEKHYANSCIIRVSMGLNGAGHAIPPDSAIFRTKLGADKQWYGLRVNEFWNYMLRTCGQPSVHSPKGEKANIEDFVCKRGIIGFRVDFDNATGHFTLWNGSQLLYGGESHDYFDIAYEAALWEC
jgi:Type VI secretion system (T6SS), amidase effector protein 4